MTLRVPSNCNGHRKGDLINIPDELCITSACRPPSLKALLFIWLVSHHFSPPCLALQAAVQQVSVKPLALDRYDHLTECFQEAGRITEMGAVFKTHTPGVIHQ